MKEARKVFVTQEQSHINYAQAELFGDVVFVSADDVPTVKGSLRMPGVVAGMKSAMEGYVPGHDYILPAGSPLNIAAVMMLAGRVGSKHNILKWESRQHGYTKVVLDVPK